jgi:hypothetical protein
MTQQKSRRRFWTEDDLRLIGWLYPHVATIKIAQLLKRDLSSVYQAAAKLGLSKSPEYMAATLMECGRKARRAGEATRFKPGLVPWNKGLRRPGWSPGRMRETQFKPGTRSGSAAKNWCPIGTIRIDHEGFQRIKVREWRSGEATGFGNTTIWPLLNRHVWEEHNGPIPPSHAVVFRNGDRGNCDIGNLELLSRADLARRNSMWNRYPRELAEAIQLNGALKRKLRRIAP